MFDQIAPDWVKKRAKPWLPFTTLFEKWYEYVNKDNLQGLPTQEGMLIDLGSGTGRHTPFFGQYVKKIIDLDLSRSMLMLDNSSKHKIQADLKALPFRNESFDVAVSVASLHHIKGKNHRLNTLREIVRISKNKSLIFITVWRFFQKKFKREFINQIREFPRESEDEIGDVIVPWTVTQGKEKITIDRFYHLYRASEFSAFVRPYHILDKGSFGNATRFGNKEVKAEKATNFYAVIQVEKERKRI